MRDASRHARPAVVLLIGIVTLLGACGGDDDVDRAETTERQAAVGTVTLEITGGIAGYAGAVRVHADGTIETIPPTGGDYAPAGRRLDADHLAELHELVGDGRFEELDDSYVPADACCDVLFYTVTAELDGDPVTTETADTGERPEPLGQIITMLQAQAG